jgi:hypothetical protein
MAGDWIKMRSELFTHPKFLSLCSKLIYDEDEVGLLIYTCGDALGLDVFPPSKQSITDRALRCVTEKALRDVTLAALLRVWCVTNAHCKVIENDAIMSPLDLDDLDLIAGFRGFGLALKFVGWVIEIDDNSLVFPNFLEFNEPACLRVNPKTNAERQREFRARRTSVTDVTKSNGREEKRREEKRIQSPSPSPSYLDGPSNKKQATVFIGLRDEMLGDNRLMMEWLDRAIREDPKGKLADCDEQRIFVLGAATLAIKKGHPQAKIAYFIRIVGGGHVDWVKDTFRESGEHRFRQWKASQNGNGKSNERPADSGTEEGNGLPRTPPAAKP